MVTKCTASLTFSNSTFCPHSAFMCFVWIWEQTAIIPLYSINWLVFIIETECLLRGTDWIFIYNSGSWSQASQRIGWVRYRVSPYGICEPSVTVTGFLSVLRFPAVNIGPPMLHNHLASHDGLTEGLEIFKESRSLSDIGENLTNKTSTLFGL